MRTQKARSALALCLLPLTLTLLALPARAQVVINELMYHPVEADQFTPEGAPVLDLSADVHEYVEIHNAGSLAVSLAGWQLDGGVQYTFPNGVSLAAGGYLVVAKDPTRLAAVPAYGLTLGGLHGPYTGQLSNNGERVELRNGSGQIVDAVSFSEGFPWPTGADALGATDRWLGFDPITAQYRGRSLERVSVSHSSQDPANWLASPWPGEPSPGRPNAVVRSVPFPVVIESRLAQVSNGQTIIRSNQPALLTLRFSATNELGAVRLEYFVDEVNRTNEVTTNVVMSGVAPEFTAQLPGLNGRSMVRYRVWAERLPREGGSQEQVVLPRADDCFRWLGYFVTPARVSTNDIYDLLISSNSLFQLARNLNDNPRIGWVAPLGTAPPGGRWNLTEPATLAYRGTLYDVQVRHAGSFWRREPGRRSFKVDFPAYHRIKDYRTLMILEKDGVNAFGHRISEEAGLPSGRTRWVDLYVNSNSRDTRLEIEEHDQQMLDRYVAERHQLNPSQPVEPTGRIFKGSGFSPDTGPYGFGIPYQPNAGWSSVERYAWNFSSKNMDWEGWLPLKQVCEELAAARAKDIPTLRAYLTANWDVDRMLTYLAIRNWMAETDDGVHNFFLWRTGAGKWTMLGWDFDNSMSQSGLTLYSGGNLFKESFLTAFREEYNQKIYWLTHTVLDPDQLATMGITYIPLPTFAAARRQAVIAQTGLGVFYRPVRPASIAPVGSESIFAPASLQATPYAHTATPPSAHAATIWKIRRADGTFHFPVYTVTSAVHRTSLPIPFALLEPGQLYYWTCAYLDTEGHPSVNSDPASFRYGGNFQRKNVLSMNETTVWKYYTVTNLGTAWRTPTYDDSTWLEGPPLLGVSAAALGPPVRTALPLGRMTYYFRKKFTFTGDPAQATLRLQYLIDDGAIFFLNGVELLRDNMPSTFGPGVTPYTVPASIEIGDPTLSSLPLGYAVTNLVAGQNVLAVEVHQKNTNSPDVIFGLTLDITTELDSSGVRLNEVLALNRHTLPNGSAYPDWIELHNPTDQPQSLNGFSLTDDPLAPLKFSFPPGTQMGPRGYLLVWCDAETGQPGLHTGFSLRAEGESIWLFNSTPSGLAQVDQLESGLQLADHSLGRVPDGTGDWTLNQPTPLTANRAEELASSAYVRINEWMASPTSGPDWFELFNPDLRPVSIGGHFLSDDSSSPTNSPIPALSYLGGYSFSKFIADEDPAAGADHVRFKLSAGGEEIALYDPAQVPIDQIAFEGQTSGLSQGRLPDGQATIVSLFNGASPGRSNAGDADGDGIPNAWEQASQLNPLFADDANEDPDGDGLTNLEEFLAGTDPNNSGDLLRVTSVERSSGGVRLRFSIQPGRVYDVQHSLSVSAGVWQSLAGVGPESIARMVEVLDPNLTGVEGRFYRVVLRRIQ